MLEKYMKTLREAEGKQYYYIVNGGSYTIPGYYYNNDIHAYTPEGDEQGEKDGWKSTIFNSWDELLNGLDDELLLNEEIEDFNPDNVTPVEKNGCKVLLETETTKFETDDDEDGHYWEGEVLYEIWICEV